MSGVFTRAEAKNLVEIIRAVAQNAAAAQGVKQMTKNIGTAFRNADSDEFGRLVRCLDFMAELPFFKAYKGHSWQSLKIEPGQVVLDVGCGTGSDLTHLASLYPDSHFIGVDKSENFLNIAKQRSASLSNVQLLPADALQLPLNKESVDAVR